MSEVSLKEYFEALLREKDVRDQQRFDAQSEGVRAAMAAAEKAVEKAAAANEKRFDNTNEWRGALNDQSRMLVPRAEFDGYKERHNALAERITKIEGRSTGIASSWLVLIGAISAAGILITIFLKLN